MTSTTNATNTVLTGTSSTQVIHSMHMDYIHDVAFDVYGRRMATCSGDRFVRIFELSDSGQWHIVAEWQAHKGSVTHLSWAHPEFGSLLATCGSDHDAKIWEEHSPTSGGSGGGSTNPMTAGAGESNNNSNSSTLSRWICATSLTEARRTVNCVQFAPRQFGLKIATGSADGCVRIYEAVDVMNLSQWPLQATLSVVTSSDPSGATAAGLGEGVTCLSWSTGRFEPPTLVVGTGGMAPSGSGSNASTSSNNATTMMMMKKTNSTTSTTQVAGNNNMTTTTTNNTNNSFLSVCVIYRYSESARQWQAILQLPVSGKRVLDVAWAPNVGRRFHYIATAEHDQLRIFKLSRNGSSSSSSGTAASGTNASTNTTNTGTASAPVTDPYALQVESIQTLDSNAKVTAGNNNHDNNNTSITPPSWTTFWRCQWNITGTVLSSSGDGGVVQLWKADSQGKFKCVSFMQGDFAASSNHNNNNNNNNNNNMPTTMSTLTLPPTSSHVTMAFE